MSGGKIETVETIGNIMLCCYGSSQYPGWAVFQRVKPKPGEPEWQSICNGRFEDVIKKYVDALAKQ